MTRARFLLAVLVFAASTGACSQEATPVQQAEPDFAGLIDKYYAAWNTSNPDNAAPLYAKNPDLVFYDVAPLKYEGWAAYDKGVRAVLGSFASFTLTRSSDLRVTRRGDVAWTTVTFRMSATPKGGAPTELEGRHTVIWEQRGVEWLIVHEHVSAPLAPTPSAAAD